MEECPEKTQMRQLGCGLPSFPAGTPQAGPRIKPLLLSGNVVPISNPCA